MSDIEVFQSQLYFKPYFEGMFFRGVVGTVYDDGLVHLGSWFLKHPNGELRPQHAACYGLFRGAGALPEPAPVTCLFCLGWYGQPPHGYEINQESLDGAAGQP